ncbi:MAG TPA: aminopeptidase [Gemmatimonadales bacterium]
MSRRALSLCFVVLPFTLVATSGCNSGNRASETETGSVKVEDSSSTASRSRKFGAIAEKVVAQSAGVKEGDVVLVFGSDEDLPLLEDIAVEVRKQGASPIVTVATNQLSRRMYDEVPAKYDALPPEGTLKLAGVVDVIIGTEAGEPRLLKGVPAERIAARTKAFAPVNQLMRQRGIRSVILGNGLYPSAEQAEQFGIAQDELAEMMYSGIDTDYREVQANGERVRKLLGTGKEVRITHPNGTDLRMGIAGRPISINDGVVSAQEARPNGSESTVWLPAGEVYLIPVPGTAVGTLVSDQEFVRGERVKGLQLEFKGGKLVSMTAKSGLEPLKASYDAAGPGKDVLSVLDIGINPTLKVPDDNPIHAWSKAGRVTVVVGNNTWAGGTNQVNFGISPSSPGTTLTVDGKVLIQDGKLLGGDQVAFR